MARLLLFFTLLCGIQSVRADDSSWYSVPLPDRSDWSTKRLERYDDGSKLGEPLAVLAIPALELSVRVYEDGVPLALEAGGSWVTGTAEPGSVGNVAIAGHRDSFFRPLEGIPKGTEIHLSTARSTQTFDVVDVSIVDALDIAPLDPTDETVLTLITCHPFRYRGYAPDRYIIRANLLKAE
jgi:sortase A